MTLPFRRAAFVRAAPFAVFMAFLGLRGLAPAEGGWFGFDPRWLYALQVAVVGGLLAAWWREYGELARQTAPTAREALLAVVVGVIVFLLWVRLDAPWMTVSAGAVAPFVALAPGGGIDWTLAVPRLVGAALLVPLMEEIFWRSFLMRWLQHPLFESVVPARVGLKAVVLATFLFVLAHTLWLAAAVAGLAYAWLYIRTGKLWVAVIAHAVTNATLGAWVLATGNWQFW
jgi:hypothetical protein